MTINKKIIIGIISHSNGLREFVRKGWLTLVPNDIEALFVIGNPKLKEVVKEGDTIFVPCEDDYLSLPIKVKEMLKYFCKTYDFEYVLKCDDDSFVRPEKLLNLKKDGEYIGVIAGGVEGEEEFDTYSKLTNNRFRDYFCSEKKIIEMENWQGCVMVESVNYAVGGAGYLLNKRAAEIIVNDPIMDCKGSEDVYVGSVMYKNNIDLKENVRFNQTIVNNKIPTKDNEYISTHGVKTMYQVNCLMNDVVPFKNKIKRRLIQ